MFLVGLTGGISTGKSTVASVLRILGIEIIDADLIAHEVVEPGKKAWKKIKKEFGPNVFHDDGTLNREALGKIVFSDPDKRKCLNSITHPEVYKSILFKTIKLFFTGSQFAIVDLPLLYESGKMGKYLHKTIVVACDAEKQLQRLMSRNNLSETDALARINAQMPLSEKMKLADYVIMNDGDKEDMKSQITTIVEDLRHLNTHWKYRIIVFSGLVITASLLTIIPYIIYSHVV